MLNDAVIKAVIATIDSGCRQGELRRLHWSDLQGNTLRVTKQSLEVVGALVSGKFGPDGRLGHPGWAGLFVYDWHAVVAIALWCSALNIRDSLLC